MSTEPVGAVARLNGVGRVYASGGGDVHALRSIDLALDRGELIALRGRSGSGKTTLLNIIGALDRPTDGTVEVLGRDLGSMSTDEAAAWRRKELGFIFQNHGLLPTMSALENVDLALRIAGLPRSERQARALEQLERVGLSDWCHHRPEQLSGGQQQRVAIARATAWAAPLIIADEPTGELDSDTGHDILSLLRSLVDAQGITVLVATHDLAVDAFADRTLVLDGGRLRPLDSNNEASQ